MIAHQAVEAVEVFPHVCRASRNIYPRCRSKPEHRLRPVQYGQQALQRFRIESTTHFDPAPASQLNKQNTVAPGIVAAIPRRGGNHFDGNKSSSSQLPSTMHALTIFIKRLYRQASLMAKSSPQQSTRFKLRNQGLNLGQTTSPVLHSHFAHSYSAPLNEEREQGGLLGRIRLMSRLEVSGELKNCYEQEALVEPTAPYYALYSYKVMSSDRFDLLGNCLAILTGIASPEYATNMLTWIEAECEAMRGRGELVVDLPPCLFPYILPHHADWLPRYERYNRPGDYHNGGVWPFICGFYVSACVAAGQMELAERRLLALTELVKPWHENAAEWGFNEWIHAQTGKPSGRDWQTWSAAMYLYAAESVLQGRTRFFDDVRSVNLGAAM